MTISELAAQHSGKLFVYWTDEDDGKTGTLHDVRVLLREEVTEELFLFPNWEAATTFRERAQFVASWAWFDLEG